LLHFFSFKTSFEDIFALVNIILLLVFLWIANLIGSYNFIDKEHYLWIIFNFFIGVLFGLLVMYSIKSFSGGEELLHDAFGGNEIPFFTIIFGFTFILPVVSIFAVPFICIFIGYSLYNSYQNTSTSWLELPIFVIPMFAFIGYITSTVIIGPEAKETLIPNIIVKRFNLQKEIEEYKIKLEEWQNRGYNLSKLDKILKYRTLIKKVKNLRQYEEKIQKLKQIENGLLSLNTMEYKSEIQSIREKLKDPEKVDVTELEFLSLKLKIERAHSILSGKKLNYYKILGIKKDASPEQIKSIYKKLSLIYHPDTGQHLGVDGDRVYREIKDAYETLIDPEKRRKYDEELGI